MKESFILHANSMSKSFKINFKNQNAIKFNVFSEQTVYIKVFSNKSEILNCKSTDDILDFNFSDFNGEVIEYIDVVVFILDAFTKTKVDIEMMCYNQEIELVGDFHCHTRSSGDGRYTVEELVEKAQELSLDFITTTDHNSIVANFVENDKMLIIPGLELTNKFGHCNLLGKKIPLNEFNVKTYEQQLQKINEAQCNNAIFVANHPFSPKSRSWLVPILEILPDMVEIWNGPWGMHNRVAFEWWIDLLNSGKYIPAIGGSDFHFEDENKALNRPTNNLSVRFNSINGILESALNGKNIIKDTDIQFSSEIIDDKIKICITNVSESIHVYYYDRYNTTSKEIDSDYSEEILIEDIDSYFVVVLCDSNKRDREFLLITNPLVMKG